MPWAKTLKITVQTTAMARILLLGKLFDDSGRFALSEGGGWARWMEWLIEAKNEPNFILSNKKEVLSNILGEE